MKKLKLALVHFLIFFINIFNPQSNLAQDSLGTTIPDSVRLHLVFPEDGDTLNFSRVRYAGSVLPTAKVWVQREETKVYPSGAFVGLVSLKPGNNRIIFLVKDSLGTLSDTLDVFREPPILSYPEKPTRINPKLINPEVDVTLSPGEILEVEFLGSPGGKAFFSLDKIAKNVIMVELPPEKANGMTGLYKGLVRIPSLKKYKPKPVEFKLKGKDRHTVKAKSKGRIHILPELVPFIGVTADSNNLIRTKPGGAILMELPAGIRLQIISERSGVKKFRLAENLVGYLASSSLNQEPIGTTLPLASVGVVASNVVGDWVQLRINLSEKVPFQIEQFLEPSALEITFYRAKQTSHWITYPPDDETIRMIRWRQENSDVCVLRVELNQKQQWGFYGRYMGKQLWLDIRKTPNFSTDPDSLLRGLIFAVDPGHGGDEPGAIGATGLEEKAVNLQYALKVADLLETEGATVIRTRTQDTTMTLRDRVEMARKAQAHIYVWLHNNSIGPATDPLLPRGTSTYFTVPHSLAIAKAVYPHLLNLGLNPFGRISSTYFVTRQTSMITFLVEGAFLSHPEDEMLLMDDEFLDKLAQAVVEGIKDFVAAQLPFNSEKPPVEPEDISTIK